MQWFTDSVRMAGHYRKGSPPGCPGDSKGECAAGSTQQSVGPSALVFISGECRYRAWMVRVRVESMRERVSRWRERWCPAERALVSGCRHHRGVGAGDGGLRERPGPQPPAHGGRGGVLVHHQVRSRHSTVHMPCGSHLAGRGCCTVWKGRIPSDQQGRGIFPLPLFSSNLSSNPRLSRTR